MSEERKCKYCGKLLIRKRKAGKLESARDFNRREFCDKRCSSKHQHSGASPIKDQVKEAAEVVSSSTEEAGKKKTAADFLTDVINNEKADMTTRVNAAKALLPYQETKANEKPGKKQQQDDAAKEAGKGLFKPMQGPKVVGINRG